MRTLLAVLCVGILAGALIERGWPSEGEPVIAVGGIESPLPTPRIRVRNLHDTVVHVFVASGRAADSRHLGAVPALATMTFPLPVGGDSWRLAVETQAGGERFVSRWITGDQDTDIGLEVVSPIERSRVEVSSLRVIRAAECR